MNLASNNLWMAASITSAPMLRGRVSPCWRLVNPTPSAMHLGHEQSLAAAPRANVKKKLTRDMRTKLLQVSLSTRDVIVLNFGEHDVDRARAGLLAGLTPVIQQQNSIATTIRTDTFLLELTLYRHKMLEVRPWVFDDTASSMHEGDISAMDVTWFGFLRPGIDRLQIDVAGLVPMGWPDLPRETLATWLNSLFIEEINPTLPAPFQLDQPPSDIDPAQVAQARELLTDILLVDPVLTQMPHATLSVGLPNGAFGVARFDRHSAQVPLDAADRLSVLVHMASEDIKGSAANLDLPHHTDLMPRRQAFHAGGLTVVKSGPASAHETVASFGRLAALYHAKRNSWVARWSKSAPDGLPVPDSTIQELDELFGWVDGRRAA